MHTTTDDEFYDNDDQVHLLEEETANLRTARKRHTREKCKKDKRKRTRGRRQRKIIVLILGMLAFTTILMVTIHLGVERARERARERGANGSARDAGPSSRPPRSKRLATVLLWNEAPGALGDDHASELVCGSYDCLVTSDRHRQHITEFDAIVFNAARSLDSAAQSSGSGPSAATATAAAVDGDTWPAVRSARQLYVYASALPLAAAVHTATPGLYNMTMTYRLDSDLVWRDYELREDIDTFNQPAANYTSQAALAYAVSGPAPCRPQSSPGYGALMLDEMRLYMPVTMLGPCGDNAANQTTFKFFLSFEDVLCPDYIPNSVYEALLMGTVPVVVSGANLTSFLPPGSYIDAQQFASVRELAEYLVYLDARPELFAQHLAWRSSYRITAQRSPLCQLCTHLHLHNGRQGAPTDAAAVTTVDANWWSRYKCHKDTKLLPLDQTANTTRVDDPTTTDVPRFTWDLVELQ